MENKQLLENHEKPVAVPLSKEDAEKHSKNSKLTLFGGFLVHLVLGSFYLWPNVIVYITSYFRF